MKKIFSLLFFSFVVSYASTTICVSILPQKTFVKKITKDLANVYVMIPKGSSPHSYEPKPSQMKDISNATLYMAIGVEFEEAWLDRFVSQNKNLQVIDTTIGITKIAMQEHHHDEDEHKHKEEKHDDHDGLDPHVWTSPTNIKIIAKNILDALVKADSKNADAYIKNYNEFIDEITSIDKQIKDILINTKNKKFLVFHPSFGYYAKEYDLTQLSIEISGKEPKPKELAHLIKEAKANDIKVVFTSPEFSDKSAKVLAKELGAKVIKVSPLSEEWSEDLINMSKAIAN